jgi:hypothetical protein
VFLAPKEIAYPFREYLSYRQKKTPFVSRFTFHFLSFLFPAQAAAGLFILSHRFPLVFARSLL